MKQTILFRLVILTLAIPLVLQAQGPRRARVLFLGNSYTYMNDLPQLVFNIAKANGDTLVYDSNCQGGFTFNSHFNSPASKTKINLSPWDFVILQGQSQEPSMPPLQVNAQSRPYVLKLDSMIKKNNACATTVFFETWGYKNGDASNCAANPAVCTYTGMQNRLKQSYKTFADTTRGIMAPVGEAFRRSVSTFTALNLYQADESHPSPEGSYLAAAVFYEVLFQRSVVGNTYNPGIATNSLSFLQFAAHKTVNDSLLTWNIGKYLPWADFTYSASAQDSYQFSAGSPGLGHKWYFGDGLTSVLQSPSHTYTMSGTFTVSHVVTNVCKKDSTVKIINNVSAGLEDLNRAGRVRVYPNPCGSVLAINFASFEDTGAVLEVINILGETVYSSPLKKHLDTSRLVNGIYMLRIRSADAETNCCFIKNE